jgi:prepilin-type N-terminal cleavage/methylation domain-containing protein
VNVRKTSGFTLIELLLAIGILGLILTMLAVSFAAVAHSKVHGENRLYADSEGRAIIWQLTSELRDVVENPNDEQHTLLIGQGHTRNGSPVDTLTLATYGAGHHRALFGFGVEDVVTYAAQPNPQYRGWFVLTRTQQNALLPAGASSFHAAPVVLADNLLGLHLRYFDGTRWEESWDSSAVQNNNAQALPLAVSIDLSLAAPGGRPMNFSTQVSIPISVAGVTPSQ